MHGPLVTPAPTSAVRSRFLHVEVGDAQRIVLDELAARLDHVAHQAREYLVGHIGLSDLDPKQRTIGRIERGLPQLLGVHFSETLVALDAETLAAGGEHRIEELGRTRYADRPALGVSLSLF